MEVIRAEGLTRRFKGTAALTEVDLAANPEAAARYRVMAAPAIAINGRLEFAGTPSAAALRERLEARWREAQE